MFYYRLNLTTANISGRLKQSLPNEAVQSTLPVYTHTILFLFNIPALINLLFQNNMKTTSAIMLISIQRINATFHKLKFLWRLTLTSENKLGLKEDNCEHVVIENNANCAKQPDILYRRVQKEEVDKLELYFPFRCLVWQF